MGSRWKVMSPDLQEHPNYRYIDVVRATDYDAAQTRIRELEAALKESWANERRLSARIVAIESTLRKIGALTDNSGMSTAAVMARDALFSCSTNSGGDEHG